MSRALVLGATGHIGSHIVRALLREGHEVRAAYRNPKFLHLLEGLPVERLPVDIETLEGVPQALEGCRWVFHAAGYYPSSRTPREEAVKRGIATTQRLVEQFKKARPERIIFTSSAAALRRVAGRLSNEDDAEPWPLDGWRPLYSTVKIAMEHEMLNAFRKEGLPVVVVNPAVCLGEYDAHPFSGRLILVFAKNRLPFYLDLGFNFVYTGDVAAGHLRAAEKGQTGQRYLLAGRNMMLKEFSELVARQAGVKPPRWCMPNALAQTVATATEIAAYFMRTEPLLPLYAVRKRTPQQLDGGKAIREFSLPQTPVEEALRRALAWFKDNRYL